MGENILLDILANTRAEVAQRQARRPWAEVRAQALDAPEPLNFEAALVAKKPALLRQGYGGQVAVIAEVKKASPSRGVIRAEFDPVAIARGYEAAGAAAISVLTDEKYFGGKLEYLRAIRSAFAEASADKGAVTLPILRKDFIIDTYQVWEARAAGADAVLLIAEALAPDALKELLDLTRELGMRALVESHDREHLERALASSARLIGINNRNLSSLRVDLMNTERLASIVPGDRLLVSESGIASAADVRRLAACGVRAVLVGETLMTASDVGAKLRELSLLL